VKLSHTLNDFSFIFGLFNDAVRILNHTASNGRMIGKLIGKGVKGSGHSLI
jgi:hypothetical protein